MKKNKLFILLVIIVQAAVAGCQNKQNKNNNESATAEKQPTVINENIRFCESTYPYEDGILIGNFGTEQLNPLNNEKKGYINYYKDGKTNVLIAADSNLSAPKGMFIRSHRLFISDVNKIVVYNLKALKEAPEIITFPEDDLFINDLAADGNTLYASVTNSGRIYRIDIANPVKMTSSVPVKWLDVTGPNGIIIDNGIMYVASYPADGNTTDANVIYQITDLSNPVAEKFISLPGQYDGIALSTDKKTMYITNWTPAGISTIDMSTKKITPLATTEKFAGPADITVINDTMYIPDLPNSRMVILPL